jgi:hypothetical protein
VHSLLRQGIDDMRARRMKHRRSRGAPGFQAFVAFHAAVDVVDGIAVFPDQCHAVDATITRIEEGHIVNEAIGKRDPKKPQGPLADAEHGDKLFARRRHRHHPHQPNHNSRQEYAPAVWFQAHRLALRKSCLFAQVPR